MFCEAENLLKREDTFNTLTFMKNAFVKSTVVMHFGCVLHFIVFCKPQLVEFNF